MEASWGPLGPSRAILRLPWAVFGSSWAVLEASWNHLSRLGGYLGRLGGILEAIWELSGVGKPFRTTSGRAFRVAGGLGRSPRESSCGEAPEPKPRGSSTTGTPVINRGGGGGAPVRAGAGIEDACGESPPSPAFWKRLCGRTLLPELGKKLSDLCSPSRC